MEIIMTDGNKEEKKESVVNQIKRENQEKLENLTYDPKTVLGEMYPVFKSQMLFRKMKGRDKRNFSVLDEVTTDLLITYYKKTDELADEETVKIFANQFMEDSSIGKRNKDGEYHWQSLDGETTDDKLDLAWLIWQEEKKNGHTAHLKEKKIALPGDDPQDENYVPIPSNHPINSPNILITIHKELGTKMVGEDGNGMLIFGACSSIWFNEDPNGIAGLGVSSVGKTFTINTVLKQFPEVTGEVFNDKRKAFSLHDKPYVFRIMDITLAALYRIPDAVINRKIIYQGEKLDAALQKASSEDAKVAMVWRQFQSQGRYNRVLSEQEKAEFAWVSNYIDKHAKISLIMESAETIEQQDINRTIPLSFDESKEQTERIGKFIAEGKGKPFDPIIRARNEPSKIIQDIISQFPTNFFQFCDYVNPYYEYLSEIILKKYNYHPHTRRMTAYVFGIVETLTKICYRNRKIKEHPKTNTGRIIYSNASDNLLGMLLTWNSMEQAITQTTQSDYMFLGIMKEALIHNDVKLLNNTFNNPDGTVRFQDEGEWWTASEMSKATKKGKERTREAIKKLQELGFIRSKPMGKSGRYWKYCINDDMIRSETSIGLVDFLPFYVPMEYHNDPCFIGRPDFQMREREIIYPNMPSFRYFAHILGISPIQLYLVQYIIVQENFYGYEPGNTSDECYILSRLPILKSGLPPYQRKIWIFYDATKPKFSDRSPGATKLGTSVNGDEKSPETKLHESPEQTYHRELKKEMRRLAKEDDNGKIKKGDLIKFTASKGMVMDILDKTLENMQFEGDIQEPFPNIYKFTE